MGWLLRDLRHASRMLLRSPGFTVAALLTLMLGIGANTAIFSVVNSVLLKPLPFPDSNRLVLIASTFPSEVVAFTSERRLLAFKGLTRSLEDMSAYDFSGPGLNVAGGESPERLRTVRVSHDFFRLFGAKPEIGRTFSAEEDRPGGPRAVVISDGLWKRHFARDVSLIGRAIPLSGELYTVIGVIAPGFVWEPRPDVWLALQADPSSRVFHLEAAARLRSGVSLEAANTEVKQVSELFWKENPEERASGESAVLLDMRREITGDVRGALLILSGAVGMVLLIACANVANLLLARAASRQKEIAVRTALGAGRLAIIRQLIVESLLLALLGATLGTVAAYFGVRTLVALNSDAIPRLYELQGTLIDGAVLVFTLTSAVVTGLLFGIFPAFRSSRVDLSGTLKESTGRSTSALHQSRARDILVVGETALAVVLLSGSALLVRSFLSMRSVDPGVETRNVLTMATSLASSRYKTTDQVADLTRRAVERFRAVPGVQAASLSVTVPFERMSIHLPFSIEGRAPAPGSLSTEFRFVSADYFDVFRIPLLRGRLFRRGDNSEPVAVVNQAFAKRFFPGVNCLGQRLDIAKGAPMENPPRRIIGVVGDVHERGIRRGTIPVLYVPLEQVPDAMMAYSNRVLPLQWAVRSNIDKVSLAGSLRRALLTIDPELALFEVRTMQEVLNKSMQQDHFNAAVLTAFAAIALLLAALGIYGVMSYTVAQRTHEIGIRSALGASRVDTWRLVAGHGLALAGAGLVIGSAFSFMATRLLSSLLYGVQPRDPLTFSLMALALGITALMACSIPAWRAMAVDPAEALRWE